MTAFLANQPSAIQYAGDISAPSVFNNGATGPRHTKQEYYIVFAQDEWHASSNLTLNYGLRYEYYTPLKVEDDLIVKFNIDTGQIDPNTTRAARLEEEQLPAACGDDLGAREDGVSRRLRHLRGTGQGEDLIQPIESDRVNTTLSTGPLLAFRSTRTC